MNRAKRMKKRMGKFEKFSLGVLLFSVAFYIVGVICIKSKESELNITSQQIEKQIEKTQTTINALNLSIESKTKLSYLKSVATSRGYYYNNNSEITAYVEVAE